MRRIAFALVLIVTLAAVGLAYAAPAVPFKAGTTWTYRVARTMGQGPGVDTLTVVYRGTTQYRDRTYHLMESRSSSTRTVERDYLVWSGTMFRQAAAVISDGRKTIEIVFSKPYATSGVQEQFAAASRIYEDGQEKRGAYSIAVTREGQAAVTVPAGKFTATKWNGTLVLGNIKRVFVTYAVGPLEVRGDFDVFVNGEFNHRMVVELQQGTVPK